MKRSAPCTLLIALFFCGFGASLHGAGVPRSVSASRQFIVYGADARLRGAVADLAEQTKKTALALLQEPDAWKTPILINLQYPQANLPELPPAYLNLSQTGFGLKVQLEFTIGADVSAPAVERELLRAVLLEMMYRQQPQTPAGAAYVEPPEWLLMGLLAISPGRESAPLSEILLQPVAAGRIASLDEFLGQKPSLLDSPSRDLYRAYAAVLVMTLRDAPEGRGRLARYLGDLAASASNDPSADLRAHFPSLGTDAAKGQESWTAAVTRLAGAERYRLLSCLETERQLALALQIGIARPNQPATLYALDEFPSFIREPSAPDALRRLQSELLLLAARANPLYRPVLDEYQEVVRLLARRREKRLPQRLAELRGLREQLGRRMSAVGDYLNWYEATQSRTVSGVFDEYMKAAELAVERTSKRRDPISVYLDALESQF
ncbi:MAG: hypothetical protein ABI883_02905 [Chthoniobacterales bacterium]